MFPSSIDKEQAQRRALKLSALLDLGFTRAGPAPVTTESVRLNKDTRKISQMKPAMGTVVSITVVHKTAPAAEDAIGSAFDEMERLIAILNRFDPLTALAQLNQEGRHVYCEKAMTRTEEETHRVAEAVSGSDVVFQLGHQNRQLESHKKAREIVEKDILGKITLVETTTNRNDPIGAWVYDIHPKAGPDTIDWEQFQEPAPNKVPFSAERFFRWRCWFDYATGLSGDLLSHEYDAINQILGLGIPKSAMASGGVYFFKGGRDVPDVFQVVFEYPDRDLTLIYSATLASERGRGKVLMGHDATMEVGRGLRVIADTGSTRYKGLLEKEIIDTELPLLTYRPGQKGIDAVTSATEEYFASRGLLFTYQGGRRVSTLHLHIKEWLDCIRDGGETSCSIERGFEEGITCHMATQSYLLGRKVEWDPFQKKIV